MKSTKIQRGIRRGQGLRVKASDSRPFEAGALVLVTLNNPREKFWGVMLALDPAGVSVRGIELSSFEDATTAVVTGEPLVSNALFFPMHRVERIQLDLPEGALPSLSQRFQTRTGIPAAEALLGNEVKRSARGAGE